MTPIISVILPVHNVDKYLDKSINSILDQSFSDFELIIINDASTDSSKSIIMDKADKRIVYLENQNKQGITKSLNKGIFYSRGKYLVRMDADDVSLKDRFRIQYEYLELNSHVDILGTSFGLIDANDEVLHPQGLDDASTNKVYYPKTHDLIKIHLLEKSVISHPSVILRKESLVKNRLTYDKNALYAEDYKLWVDSCLCNLHLENLEECLLLYRIHSEQTSNPYNVVQRNTTNYIMLADAMSFFHDIIKGNETEYLQLVSSRRRTDKVSNDHVYIKMVEGILSLNDKMEFFKKDVFNDFMEEKFKRFINEYQV